MTTAAAMTLLGNEITQVIKEYDNSPEGKDTSGTRIAHVLDTVTDAEKLWAINDSLVYVALQGYPRDLFEDQVSGTAPKLYDYDGTYYVRRPAAATDTGDDLDMSEGLAEAVVYYALYKLDSSQMGHYKKTSENIRAYLAAEKHFDANP